MRITKRFTFEASHILPLHPGKCSRLHGHSWGLEVEIEGPVNKDSGFVVDFHELSHLVHMHIISQLDHTHLGYGDVRTSTGLQQASLGANLYPTSENLSRAIYKILSPLVKELATDVFLREIRIAETCTSGAAWSRADEEASTCAA